MKKWMKLICLSFFLSGCSYFQPTDKGGMVNEVKEIYYIKNSELAEENFSVTIYLKEDTYYITANHFYDATLEKTYNVEEKEISNEQFEKVCEFCMDLPSYEKKESDEFMLDGTTVRLTIDTALGGKGELSFTKEYTYQQLEAIILEILQS